MGKPISMADSVNPNEIPSQFRQQPNGVAGYLDGDFAWSDAEFKDFPRYWKICVSGNPNLALEARVIDVETGDATPEDVAGYQHVRQLNERRTYVYCDQSTVPDVVHFTTDWRALLWWIALLDGVPYTRAEVHAMILDKYDVDLPVANIIAAQLDDRGSYDYSRVYGNPDWTHNVKPQ